MNYLKGNIDEIVDKCRDFAISQLKDPDKINKCDLRFLRGQEFARHSKLLLQKHGDNEYYNEDDILYRVIGCFAYIIDIVCISPQINKLCEVDQFFNDNQKDLLSGLSDREILTLKYAIKFAYIPIEFNNETVNICRDSLNFLTDIHGAYIYHSFGAMDLYQKKNYNVEYSDCYIRTQKSKVIYAIRYYSIIGDKIYSPYTLYEYKRGAKHIKCVQKNKKGYFAILADSFTRDNHFYFSFKDELKDLSKGLFSILRFYPTDIIDRRDKGSTNIEIQLKEFDIVKEIEVDESFDFDLLHEYIKTDKESLT